MTEHFKKQGDGYDLSPAAVLLVISDTLRRPDTTPAVKERALRTINQVMAIARRVKFEPATTLETMLVLGDEPARMLPMCDALVKHVGDWAILTIVRRVMGDRIEHAVAGAGFDQAFLERPDRRAVGDLAGVGQAREA